MKNLIIIDENSPKQKGCLHTHTKIDFPESDGLYEEADVVEFYRKHGYNFFANSNHEIMYEIPQIYNDFLIIPSMEVSCNYIGDDPLKGTYTHFNIFGGEIWNNNVVYPAFEYESIKDIQRAINFFKSRGYLIQWNHPLVPRFSDEEFLSLRNYDFLEIYNQKDFLERAGMPSATYIYRTILHHGHRIMNTANNDFHGKKDQDLTQAFIKAFVMVDSDLSQNNILSSLANGNFYSSNGPKIFDYRVENGIIKIKTSPVNNILFLSNLEACKNVFSLDGPVEYAEYEISGKESYIFVQVVGQKSNLAWTQPIWVKDLIDA
jgi:hypothetical protein